MPRIRFGAGMGSVTDPDGRTQLRLGIVEIALILNEVTACSAEKVSLSVRFRNEDNQSRTK